MANVGSNGLSLAALFAAAALSLAACSSAPKAPEAVFETANKAAELSKLGDGFMAKRQYAIALEYYHQARDASSSVDDIDGVAAANSSGGRASLALGALDEAQAEYGASLDYARMSGEAAALSRAKAGLGEVAFARGDLALALERFEEAVAAASSPGGGKDVATGARGKALAVALHDRGVAQAASGKLAQAIADYRAAEASNLKEKRWAELGANRYALASALARSGKPEEAMRAALGALEADKRAENAAAIPDDLAALATLAETLGKSADALDYWRRSFDDAKAEGNALAQRKALTALARLSPVLGKEDEGKRYSEELGKLEGAKTGE